jgi:hypothetical protein
MRSRPTGIGDLEAMTDTESTSFFRTLDELREPKNLDVTMMGLVPGMCIRLATQEGDPPEVCSNACLEAGLCEIWQKPAIRSYHRRGGCPSSTIRVQSEGKQKKINPLKASKRNRRNR